MVWPTRTRHLIFHALSAAHPLVYCLYLDLCRNLAGQLTVRIIIMRHGICCTPACFVPTELRVRSHESISPEARPPFQPFSASVSSRLELSACGVIPASLPPLAQPSP
ncbi:hypothetical protein CC80DRAFT_139865 [Byssothecium circinans]|uniref:Uncharacterized protein n=1 Tax=Byssothecium circinans TaxID=147558 RepID=A0A6A5TKT6_9PLEO|nr:hypothetical protein CC80DRAFT_139865 [Byssothecium circinans]